MNALILTGNSPAITMTSIELVALINRERREEANARCTDGVCFDPVMLRHADFMTKLEKHPSIDSPKFFAQYKDSTGRLLKSYHLPKREACLMAMSYSYELQAKVFDRMTALETGKTAPVIPQTLAQALRLAADQAERIELST